MDTPFVSIVIPCFNEEKNIQVVKNEIIKVIDRFDSYEIIFVDDGSIDKTLETLQAISKSNQKIKYLSFSRNFGHQNALKAGLDHAEGDFTITLDADLQHPPQLINKLIEKWEQGYEVVYTIRNDDFRRNPFKSLTSRIFYSLINFLSSTKIHYGAADFRLLDRKVVDELKKTSENYLFIRGLVSWMGFKQYSIKYTPGKRYSGDTKYSLLKMLRFAIAGITSFSIKPLRLSLFIGLIIAILSFLYGIFAVCVSLFTDKALPGWGSIIASVLFVGGIQLAMLGIIGEYLGKLFIENKRRPNYIIREKKL